jgi:hypothetical protein
MAASGGTWVKSGVVGSPEYRFVPKGRLIHEHMEVSKAGQAKQAGEGIKNVDGNYRTAQDDWKETHFSAGVHTENETDYLPGDGAEHLRRLMVGFTAGKEGLQPDGKVRVDEDARAAIETVISSSYARNQVAQDAFANPSALGSKEVQRLGALFHTAPGAAIKDVRSMRARLSKMMESWRTPFNMVAKEQLRGSAPRAAALMGLKVGSVFANGSFTHVTANMTSNMGGLGALGTRRPTGAQTGGVRVEYRLPKGTKAIYASGIDGARGGIFDANMILNQNTRWRVVKRSVQSGNTFLVVEPA